MAVGNRHLGYKETLNGVEQRSPGSKAAFYLNFLDNMAPVLAPLRADAVADLGTCARCGSPAGGEICAFCRIVEKASAHEPVSVEMMSKRGRR